MEIDKFNGVTNGEFIDYFKIDLHSRMEILSYTYPHELLDEDSGFGEHVQRCIALLKDYMIQCRRDSREAERKWKNGRWKTRKAALRKPAAKRLLRHTKPLMKEGKAAAGKHRGPAAVRTQIRAVEKRNRQADRRASGKCKNNLR